MKRNTNIEGPHDISKAFINQLLHEGFDKEPFQEVHPDTMHVELFDLIAQYVCIGDDEPEFAHANVIATLTDLMALRFCLDYVIAALWKRRRTAEFVTNCTKDLAQNQ